MGPAAVDHGCVRRVRWGWGWPQVGRGRVVKRYFLFSKIPLQPDGLGCFEIPLLRGDGSGCLRDSPGG